MKTANVLYIERNDAGDSILRRYCDFIKDIFLRMNYEADIFVYTEQPINKRIDDVISTKKVDIIFCDITLGSDMGENTLGLDTIKHLKLNYPEITVCGISGKDLSYRSTSISRNIPSFDFFVDKLRGFDDDYKDYIAFELSTRFSANVGIEINMEDLGAEDKKFVSQSFFLRLLKRITFTTHESNSETNVKYISLHPTSGGYSSSRVFRMYCTTENGEVVINSILKCSERKYAEKEMKNYLSFVKWYLPYTWRPEILASAFSKDYGMICYSFAYNDDKPFSSLTDRIGSGDVSSVNRAVEMIFGGSTQKWYSKNNCNTVNKSLVQFYTDIYFPVGRPKPFKQVEKVIRSSMLEGSYSSNNYYYYKGKEFPSAHVLFTLDVGNKYQECIVHGDLNTNNIQLSEDDELIFIDFQDTGKGHVFHDFVTFEVCLRLYYKTTRDFDLLLNIENRINDNSELVSDKDFMFYNCIARIRELARENFPDEDFRSYHFSLAMRTFRLFRNIDNFTIEQQHSLLACLIANLQFLSKYDAKNSHNHANVASIDLVYDVAFSFAGENRGYVEEVAKLIKTKGVNVFYDSFEQVNLWGKDLYQYLCEIYKARARYCVVFISEHYKNKLWTSHELKSAQTRAFKENREYILPARFDNTEIPGLNETIGYIDLRKISPQELANIICNKLMVINPDI